MEAVAEALCKSHIDGTENPVWLELRKTGVTATDTARLLTGQSWLDMWARKTGRVVDEGPSLAERNERVLWGQLMEPVILKAYGSPRYANRDVRPSGMLMRSLKHPWLLATLDAEALAQEGELTTGETRMRWIPVDAKNTDKYLEWKWDEGIPVYIAWQIRQQAIVMDTPSASVAVCVGGNKLMWTDEIVKPLHRRRILEVSEEFWSYVENDIPPEKPDGLPETRRALAATFELGDHHTIELDGTYAELDEEFAELKRQYVALKDESAPVSERMDAIKAAMQLAMKNHERALLPNGAVWTQKRIERKPFTSHPKPYNRVTRRGPKR